MAQGFSHVYGIDYTNTFLPTVRRESLRVFLALIAYLGFIFDQMNVIGVYLKNLLDRDAIFINVPQGLQVKRDGLVYRILKSLYGLKQAERL